MYKESLKGNIIDQEHLFQRFNDGNAEAFEYVFKASYKALSYYALKLTGSKMAAEDVVQSVFIRLWKNKNKFDSGFELADRYETLDGKILAENMVYLL